MRHNHIILRILSGYWQKGRLAFSFLIFFGAAALLSTLVVYPLWYFAVKNPKVYTLFCFIICGAGILWLFIRKFIRIRQQEMLPEFKTERKKHRRSFWISLGKTGLALISIYIVFIQFSSGYYLTGTILFLLFFFILGWIFFGGANGNKKPGRS